MNHFIDTVLMLGGVVAAVAVAAMCGVCLLVWLAGGPWGQRSGAWHPGD